MKKAKIFALAFLPVFVLACTIGCWIGIFAPTSDPVDVVDAASSSEVYYEGTYYDGLNENLTGTAFRTELASLITTTHDYNPSYDALKQIFCTSDADPDKSGNIIWFYSGTSIAYNGTMIPTNREHVWPKDGGDAFPESSAAGSDAHHLRPADAQLNSTRGSNSFGEVAQTSSNVVKQNGSTSYGNLCYQSGGVFYPGVGFRGATARILMYVQTRWGNSYNLSFVLGSGDCKTIGDIETLMKWHIEEPPTELEITRNNVVADIQGNRNPFIDHPEYAEMIYCNDGKSYNDELQAVVETYGSYLDGSAGGEDTTIEVSSLSISPASATLSVGGTSTLTVTANPTGASNKVTWSSSNSSVATVNSSGVVTAVSAGNATITATSTENASIKATASITVKAISDITLSGEPVKYKYSAGETFNPAGITVTASYSDGSTGVIANSSCEWLDGTTNEKALSQGTTTVICKYGNIEKTVTGIEVSEAVSKTMTITRANFTGSGAYTWTPWTVDGISGQAFIYPGESSLIQMNSSKDSYYIFNSTALTGGIVSITIKNNSKTTADKNWTILTSTTPFTTSHGKVATGGTNRGTLTSTNAGGTLNINTTDTYFAINYASTNAVYIDEIIITYGASSGAHIHTPGEWIIDSNPSCGVAGSKHTECEDCGEVVEAVEIPALGHSYGSWVVTTEPTCQSTGVERRDCGNCEHFETRTIAKSEHDLGEWTDVNDTIEERGCANCDYTEQRTKPNDENVTAFEDLVSAIESANGMEEKLTAIGNALEVYEALSESEKEQASVAYSQLEDEIEDYNDVATEINETSKLATENAIFYYHGALKILSVAVYFLLKA